MAEDPTFEHLRFRRSETENARRRRKAGAGMGPPTPSDIPAHAQALQQRLEARQQPTSTVEEAGFDPRLLLKLKVDGLADPAQLEHISGLQVISQEGKTVVVAFASAAALHEFNHRLDQLKQGREVVRKDILFAISDVDNWTADDRMGAALRDESYPVEEDFFLDVELWWQLPRQRKEMIDGFKEWCREQDAQVMDSIESDALVLLRLKTRADVVGRLLNHRDIRSVDLPPRYQFEPWLPGVPLAGFDDISPPPDTAPGVVVLDSGLTENHPMLAPAVGDAQSFIDGLAAQDEHGHGTYVAGLALYGDVDARIRDRSFVPTFRLFSGRITDHQGRADATLVENRVINAVAYFKEQYGCRVFNLSFGDDRRVYTGGHVDRLGALIDRLSYEEDVLFVISTGNFDGGSGPAIDWRNDYPGFLNDKAARLLDPAPALNALTVGSLARYEVPGRIVARNPTDPARHPVAPKDMPSPFTRRGPGPKGSIKPEVAEYGGNFGLDTRSGVLLNKDELGEPSTRTGYLDGRLFGVQSGTSFAAPKVAWLAMSLLTRYPRYRLDTIRALIVAHARVPDAAAHLPEEERLNLMGYGRPAPGYTLLSSESNVTLLSEDELSPDAHHFYEVELPDDFFAPPYRRRRRITVALAYTPRVRRTRIEYKETDLNFRLVRANSLAEVEAAFAHRSEEDRPKDQNGVRPTLRQRSYGTVQAATWNVSQTNRTWADKRPYLVVTHQPRPWSAGTADDKQSYSVVVVVEDLSGEEVRLYTQLRTRLRTRARARA